MPSHRAAAAAAAAVAAPAPSLAPSLELRPVTEADWLAWIRAGESPFFSEIREEDLPFWRQMYPLRHGLAVVDREPAGLGEPAIVGTAGAFELDLTVPEGRTLPAAGVTAVGVVPTHRRRGLLTALMHRQLQDLHTAGFPLAVLTASESLIYRRYGYGVASWGLRLTVPRAAAALLPGVPLLDGRLRLVTDDPGTAREVMAAVDARQRRARPGRYTRDAEWFAKATADPEHWREGASAKQLVVHEGPDGPDGYAQYVVRSHWERGIPDGTLQVQLIDAASPAVAAALWRYLFGVDLVARVQTGELPVDDALLAMIADPRRAEPRLVDGMHVRLLDVGAALSGRAYQVPVDVVIDVVDGWCPWNAGRWRLSADPAGATCGRTPEPADVTVGVADLGAAYLGGRPLRALTATGEVAEHRPGALAQLSRAMVTDLAPWNPEIF